MNPFRGDEFRRPAVMVRGRGIGRGATRANPDDNEPVQAGQGQVRGQDQFQAVGRARVNATGRFPKKFLNMQLNLIIKMTLTLVIVVFWIIRIILIVPF